ncbi:MAG: LptF/LptG family permease [Tannerellaceae bacterium]|nr:LptF/LptG family permease [Tannerellaceae bacterium]
MFRIKRLYTFMLQTFLPLFVMTFGICLFVVLMQFLWKYIDDMVGKGLDISILAEMFFYAALSLVPMALPLAILLASLMTFGNLGERLELLAMKSAGVSLFRIMRPLFITLCFVSVGAFFFQNQVLPIAQVKLYTLIYSMRQKSPELEIPESVFYSEITGYSMYVKKKDKTGLLMDVMIYDYSKGFNNVKVIVADSGRLKTSADKLFLVLSLFDGESFGNVQEQPATNRMSKEAVAYARETFRTKDILIEFDANFTRTDESMMSNQYIGKNMQDLQLSIDSMTVRLDSIRAVNSKAIYENSYQKSIRNSGSTPKPKKTVDEQSQEEENKTLLTSGTIVLNYDSLYREQKAADKAAILARAKSSIDNTRNEYLFKAHTVGDEAQKIRRHKTEWHKKFTLSFACMVFFFIGAPLGAIIRKGGLGMPVVISVLLFIVYYIIDNVGFKMARDGVWSAWEGMWLSSFILTPLGIFLTYKAINDSVILNADTYLNAFKRFFGGRPGRKIEPKEVIIHTPDYQDLLGRIQRLSEISTIYLYNNKQRKGLDYINFWMQGKIDTGIEEIKDEMEYIIEELGNSDQLLILNKLMDYPVLDGYDQLKFKFKGHWGLLIGILFPIGYAIYYIVRYKHKFLYRDISTVVKVSDELHSLIYSLK